ncbi:MAG TPA: OB-fold domain-containing protein [Thermoplasmata archaeon]|nr:OB-fold domain-containing protein [Thermoplasmata archaeon]
MTAPASHSIREFTQEYEERGRLIGFRSRCGFVTVTWSLVCPKCGARDLEEIGLSGSGRIAAFTVQTVPSEEFLNDAPYAYVVVDLAEGGRITGWIPGVRSEGELAIGQAVRFVAGYRRGIQFERAGGAPPDG